MASDWFTKLESENRAGRVPERVVSPVLTVAGGVTAYGRRALESEASFVAAAVEGTRNDALNSAAYKMGQLIPEHLTADAVDGALRAAGRMCGLPESEIDLVLRSDETAAISAGRAAPRAVEPLEALPSLTVLDGGAEMSGDAAASGVRERFPILDWDELWTREDEEEWIVEPVLPARRLVALFSPPKVGKSLLMLEIAVGVAQGSDVLGVTPDRPRRVLYIDFENDPVGDVRERLQCMGLAPGDLQNLCYMSYPSIAKFDTLAGALDLMAAVQEYGCEVVVIDTVSRAVGGEENDNDTWLSFYRHTGLALKQAGVACIRLDHSGKDVERGMRGGSAKYGDVDAVWKLSTVTDGEVYQLECTDHRMRVNEKVLVLRRETSPLLRHRVEAGGGAAAFGARVDRVVGLLDAAGLPADAGRRAAREVLNDLDTSAMNSVVDAAVRRRKETAGLLWKVDEEEGEL